MPCLILDPLMIWMHFGIFFSTMTLLINISNEACLIIANYNCSSIQVQVWKKRTVHRQDTVDLDTCWCINGNPFEPHGKRETFTFYEPVPSRKMQAVAYLYMSYFLYPVGGLCRCMKRTQARYVNIAWPK